MRGGAKWDKRSPEGEFALVRPRHIAVLLRYFQPVCRAAVSDVCRWLWSVLPCPQLALKNHS